MTRLSGKVAVVTGASRGVGRGIALSLAEEGATVYITGRSVRGASTSPELLGTTITDTAEQANERGGVGVACQCDHTVTAQVKNVFNKVRSEQGHLDILVNNAWGGYEKEEGQHLDAPFWEWPLPRWEKSLSAGVGSTLTASYFAAPLLLEPKGLIVNTTLNVDEYSGNWLFYYLPKHTINELTYTMAMDFKRFGVAVVGLSPGWTRTEAVMAGRAGHTIPTDEELKQTESPEYVGRAVVALALDSGRMERTGSVVRTRDLGRTYEFTDIDGMQPLLD